MSIYIGLLTRYAAGLVPSNLETSDSDYQSANDQATNSRQLYNLCIAISVLGAILLCVIRFLSLLAILLAKPILARLNSVLALANFTCLIALAVHDAHDNVASRNLDMELANQRDGINDPVAEQVFSNSDTGKQN
jgi:hypothetical protein